MEREQSNPSTPQQVRIVQPGEYLPLPLILCQTGLTWKKRSDMKYWFASALTRLGRQIRRLFPKRS